MALSFDVRPVDPASLRGQADAALFERLASADAARRGFPGFAPERADHASGSRFGETRAPVRHVVAGQQPGLLTGPMYTFLKAVSAITLSRRIATEDGAPIRPLFWVASEDHDVIEVNRVTVNGRRFVHPYAGSLERGRVPPVTAIALADAREPLLAFLREALPPTEFTPWVLDQVAGLDFTSYATAFTSLLRALFGAWPLEPMEPGALRARTAPVLAEIVERWPELERALEEGANTLRGAGLAPPLAGLRLFEIVAGARVPVEIDGDRVSLAAGVVSRTAAAEEIRRRPRDFSPGAALRPLCQDAVLPVVVTLGGPTELAYLWQIRPLYDVMEIRPSRLHPRISATFLEPAIARAVQKAGLAPEAVFAALESPATAADAGAAAGAGAARVDLEASLRGSIERRGGELLADIDRLDRPAAPRWLRTGRDGVASGVRRIVEGLDEERRAAAGLDRARREKIRAALLPGGRLQERTTNVIEFLNRHGPDFVARAIETLDPLARGHQVVVISSDTGRERS
jgi:bacillithiol biosynthesis cysteine-adding enzyme BshC